MARKSRCESIKIKTYQVPPKDQDQLAINQGYQMMKRLIAEAVIRDISLLNNTRDKKDHEVNSRVEQAPI